MADLLLNKVINDEISSNLLIKWLLKAVPENNEDYKNIFTCNVGQIDFITYFLNFIHEEVPCNNKLSDLPQKLNTPKRIDQEHIHNTKPINKEFKSDLFLTKPVAVQDQNSSLNTSLEKSIDNFGTPKFNKTPGNKNDSYFSPVSPLYHNPYQNSNGLKETKLTNKIRNSADKHSLCLGDFLITSSKSSTKKKKQLIDTIDSKKETSRRIKPTSICLKPVNSAFQKTENSFNFQENAEEVPVKTTTEQRNVLVEERNKIISRNNSIGSGSRPVIVKRHNSLSISDVKPMISMVTFKSNINNVVDIYKTILNQKLVLNLTSEIYFLISLFLSKHNDSSQPNPRINENQREEEDLTLGVAFLDLNNTHVKPDDINKKPAKINLCNSEIFETVHNVVYFAVKCLETQIKIVQFYDKTTIRLLAENERIRDFSLVLSKRLLTYAEKKAEKPCIETVSPISQINNVCFNIDTDNRANFPDQLSFEAFRKQRDLFYDILRIWENDHLTTGWSFSGALGWKIRSLFNLHGGTTNYMHLARLFKNQLLSSCAKGPKEKGLSENNVSFHPSLTIDSDKLNRLTNRLVTKHVSNGINSLPVFSGYQDFFKEFIIVSSNNFFNRHLCDALISEILEINDTKFSGTGLEDEGTEVDLNTQKLYVSCIKNLRMLAKFLGFIESLPYKSDVPNLPKNVLEAQIRLRGQSLPSLNVKTLLQSSIEKHTVIFIIPWLTNYLAMLDYVTLRLPYYRSVNLMLFDLHQNYEKSETSPCNTAVVQFCLGWLFELPHFPDAEYFKFCSKIIDSKQSQLVPTRSKVYQNGINGTKAQPRYLDYMDIVDKSVLYLCCPYLEEIKKILSSNAPGSKVAVKYITPVTAVESYTEMARRKTDQQLEEAFFAGQPTSLRKTIEFVSERIASAAVKHICHDLVPQMKRIVMQDLKKIVIDSEGIENQFEDENQRKIDLKKQATQLAQTNLSKFLQTSESEMQKISNLKIPPCIDSLLPVDTLEVTKKVCIGITNKMYVERVKQWINSHVNLTMFTKDIDNELQKVGHGKKVDKEKVAFILPGSGRDCDHNENGLSGFHVLNNIREACCEVIETGNISLEYVTNLLQETYNTATQRNDVNDMIWVTISMTVFDFCLLLVAGVPSLFSKPNNDLLNRFSKIWTLQPNINSMFKALFCPRNVKMLQCANHNKASWDTYAIVVSNLADKKFVDQDDLESQCIGFYNRDWDVEILDNFSHFLKKLVSYSSNCDTTENKFAYLLDFLSDFCSDL